MIAAGSSHLNQFKKGEAVCHLALIQILSFCGLIVMPKQFPKNSPSLRPFNRIPIKNKMFNDMVREISLSSATEVLWVALSNDWKYFLSEFNDITKRYELYAAVPNAYDMWTKFPNKDKARYKYRNKRLLEDSSVKKILEKLEEYIKQLQFIFGKSNVEVIFHSSVLERKIKYFPSLDMYFAVLNSLLFRVLRETTARGSLKNKHNKSIKIVYVNVTSQFHSDNNIFDRPKEIGSGCLVHRSNEALEDLSIMYRDEISRIRNSKVLK